MSLGQYESALNDFNIAVELEPKSARFYFNRAKANVYLHRVEQAKSDYETALKLAEEDNNKVLKSAIEMRMLIDGLRD